MVAYDGGYAVDFGALGLWTYNNGASMKLHNSDVEHIMASGSKLIIDFGAGAGLWEYDGDSSSWTRLSISDPEPVPGCGNTMATHHHGHVSPFPILTIQGIRSLPMTGDTLLTLAVAGSGITRMPPGRSFTVMTWSILWQWTANCSLILVPVSGCGNMMRTHHHGYVSLTLTRTTRGIPWLTQNTSQ
jgi:hypothetical protein